MKIQATCNECSREVAVDQVIGGGGSCPWCGTALSPDYALTLVDALREAQEAGTRLERAIESIADLGPALTIAEGSVTGQLRRHLDRIERPVLRQP